MHRALIIEDEYHSREFLKNIVGEYCPEVEIVDALPAIDEGIAAIQQHRPDIVFLDIEMQTGTAFDLLAHFPDPEFEVIFTTAYDHYAIKAIKFGAFDYLLKPIEIEELQQAVNKITTKKNKLLNADSLRRLLDNIKSSSISGQSITLATSEGIEFVKLDNIIRIEASGPYSIFFLKEWKKIMVSKHLKEYETLLSEMNFFRVHNSHMVNINEVVKMVKSDGGYVLMSDGSEIAVSPKKKSEFFAYMQRRLL